VVRVRDTLLGENWVKQDVKKALELAAACEYSEAVWLTDLFAGCTASTPKEAEQVFLDCGADPRAPCFAALMSSDNDLLRLSAECGNAHAQARMSWETNGERSFVWAEKAAVQGERDGFTRLGYYYASREGCKKDIERAKENYWVAAELGSVVAMSEYGELFDETDPRRFTWMGKAIAGDYPSIFFMDVLLKQVSKFNSGSGQANVVFVIGRVLKGQIDLKAKNVRQKLLL
jgi:TPR repeat protein